MSFYDYDYELDEFRVCVCCGRDPLDECHLCGAPLCPMCSETGAGFCDDCLRRAWTEDEIDELDKRMQG